jgi:hypothetical protein
VITLETALSRSSKTEQLFGLLERAGFAVDAAVATPEEPSFGSLRVAGS